MRLNCNVLFNSIQCYIQLKFQANFVYGPILWEPLWIGYGIKIMYYMQNKLRDHSFPDPRYCNSILRHGGVWQRDTSQVWPSQEWLAGRQRDVEGAARLRSLVSTSAGCGLQINRNCFLGTFWFNWFQLWQTRVTTLRFKTLSSKSYDKICRLLLVYL